MYGSLVYVYAIFIYARGVQIKAQDQGILKVIHLLRAHLTRESVLILNFKI